MHHTMVVNQKVTSLHKKCTPEQGWEDIRKPALLKQQWCVWIWELSWKVWNLARKKKTCNPHSRLYIGLHVCQCTKHRGPSVSCSYMCTVSWPQISCIHSYNFMLCKVYNMQFF